MQKARSKLARFALLLAAIAACVQWMIPHGWMVASAHETSGSGFALLVPCPSTSPGLAALAKRASSSHQSHHGHHAHQSHHAGMDHAAMGHDMASEDGDGGDNSGAAQAQCDFAALGVPALPPIAPDLAAPAPQSAVLLPLLREAIPGRGLAAPPPPATGPPSLSA